MVVFKNQKLGSGAFASVFKGVLKALPKCVARDRKFAIGKDASIYVAIKMPLAMVDSDLRYCFICPPDRRDSMNQKSADEITDTGTVIGAICDVKKSDCVLSDFGLLAVSTSTGLVVIFLNA